MTLAIVQVQDALPDETADLAEIARGEGVANMQKLIEAWASGEERFDIEGAGLFAAYDDRDMIGFGGTTRETGTSHPVMRMRRFYVRPEQRRSGVGYALAHTVIRHAEASARLLVVNARASEAAGPFWEALGFQPVDGANITHASWRMKP